MKKQVNVLPLSGKLYNVSYSKNLKRTNVTFVLADSSNLDAPYAVGTVNKTDVIMFLKSISVQSRSTKEGLIDLVIHHVLYGNNLGYLLPQTSVDQVCFKPAKMPK